MERRFANYLLLHPLELKHPRQCVIFTLTEIVTDEDENSTIRHEGDNNVRWFSLFRSIEKIHIKGK